MERFKPSIDWGHELVSSTRWILEAWAVTGTCLLIVAIVVVQFTRWGGQFWRITGDYFTGRRSAPVLTLFSVLLLSVMISVRITVLLTYYSNDLYSALQTAFQGAAAGDDVVRDSGIHGFWVAIWTFCVIATLHVIQVMADLYLAQRFFIRWRVWLTDRLTADWLDGRAYYRGRFIEPPIDNPDQRIQQDIDIFTAGVGGATNTPSVGTSATLLFGAVRSVVSVVSFATILWHLSGTLVVLGISIPTVEEVVDFDVSLFAERLSGQGPHLETPTRQALNVYLLPSALTRSDAALRAAATELAHSGEKSSDLASAIAGWVYRRMSYGFDRTSVHTTAGQALAAGHGVCQDYAHVMLALCRLLGIPARYVSGHLVGEGGTHAWVEVLQPVTDQAVEILAWDPTHDRPTDLRYLTVAVARDYRDVAPVSGTYCAPHRGRLSASRRVRVAQVDHEIAA